MKNPVDNRKKIRTFSVLLAIQCCRRAGTSVESQGGRKSRELVANAS